MYIRAKIELIDDTEAGTFSADNNEWVFQYPLRVDLIRGIIRWATCRMNAIAGYEAEPFMVQPTTSFSIATGVGGREAMTPTLDEKQAAPKGSRVDLGRYAGTYGGYIEKEAMTQPVTLEDVALYHDDDDGYFASRPHMDNPRQGYAALVRAAQAEIDRLTAENAKLLDVVEAAIAFSKAEKHERVNKEWRLMKALAALNLEEGKP